MKFALALLIFLAGCCTCPKQSLYFPVIWNNDEPRMVALEKGYFDNREHWFSQEEMDQLMEQYRWDNQETAYID